MLQITFDPGTLSKEQRTVIASFLLGYPLEVSECSHTCTTVSHLAGHAENLQLATEQAADLQAPEAVAAFGGQVPDPFAPSFVAVPPPPTAHVAPPVISAPPSAIVPTAPTSASAVSPVAPTTANPVTTDKAGYPWDGRIHSESKALNVDGTWRKRRNLDPAVLTTVEAELRQVMGIGAPPSSSEPVWQPQDLRAQYIALVGRASAAIQSGKVSAAEITQACSENGIPVLPLLANRLDLVPQVAFAIDSIIAVRG